MDLSSIPDNYKIRLDIFDDKGDHIGKAESSAEFVKARSDFYQENGIDFLLNQIWKQYFNDQPEHIQKKLLEMSKEKQTKLQEPKKQEFNFFWGNEDFASNFYQPANFFVDGMEFNCSEQYFMYKKAMFFGDYINAKKIMDADLPGKQKQLGRMVRNFDADVWSKNCERYMYEACYHKFNQNPKLKEQLLATKGKMNVEASPTDLIWGIGYRANDYRASIPSEWKGKNLLGKILDVVRDELAEDKPISETRYRTDDQLTR